jgi:hypothetical protein
MFARFCVVLLAAALLSVPASAEEPKLPELELKPKWKKGDIVRFEMTRTQSREVDGKTARKVSVHTPVEVEVVDMDEDGWYVRWTQGTTVFDDPKLDDDPLVRAIYAIQKSIDVDLDLETDGTLSGVRNWKDLRATGHKVQDAVLAQLAKAGTPKSTLESLRKDTEKLFASKEAIELAFSRQAALLFLPFEQNYELGKSATYETELPNVLGGDDSFPAIGEYTLKSMDKETGIAVIVFKLTPDPKEQDRVLRKWLDDVAKKAGKPAPKGLPELELADVIEYEFDTIAGWVKTVTHTRTVKQSTGTQIETITLVRKTK